MIYDSYVLLHEKDEEIQHSQHADQWFKGPPSDLRHWSGPLEVWEEVTQCKPKLRMRGRCACAT